MTPVWSSLHQLAYLGKRIFMTVWARIWAGAVVFGSPRLTLITMMASFCGRYHISLLKPGRSPGRPQKDRKSTRLNSSHANISYAVFCLKKNHLVCHYAPPVVHSADV